MPPANSAEVSALQQPSLLLSRINGCASAGPLHWLQPWLTASFLLLSAAAAAPMGPAGTMPGPQRCALAGRSAQGPAVPGEGSGTLI